MKLSNEQGELLQNPSPYSRLVGRLIYLTITRPDIMFVVHTLSQFMHAPRKPHLDATMRVLRYLKSYPGQCILYSAMSSLSLMAYCDSDWGSCPMTIRSTTSLCTMLGDPLISWKSKKQTTVSRSSAEAEYHAMATTSCELTWIRFLLNDLQVSHSQPAILHCDRKVALHIAATFPPIQFFMNGQNT